MPEHPVHVPSGLATRLPEPYVVALEGVLAGLTDAELAERVGIDAAAVPALVRLTTVKLVEIEIARDLRTKNA